MIPDTFLCSPSAQGVSLTIKGLAGEAVTLSFRAPDATVMAATCVVGPNGRVIMVLRGTTKLVVCNSTE